MPLLAGNPFVDECIPVARRTISNLLALRKRLRAGRFDTAIDFQGLIKSAFTASLARPERIFGFHRSQARESLAALFYSASVKAGALHVVDRYLELAAGAGATAATRSFWIPEGRPEGTLPAGDFVLANPLAGWGSKQWPLASYLKLSRRLDVPLVLNSPHAIEAPGAHVHVSGIPGLIDATRRALAVIGVDSGPLHLAAALGKPGVAIFGPTDPARNGPYGGSMTVLRTESAETTYKRRAEVAESMELVSVDQVFSALSNVLSKTVR
jgi:heptosyltransferase-1